MRKKDTVRKGERPGVPKEKFPGREDKPPFFGKAGEKKRRNVIVPT